MGLIIILRKTAQINRFRDLVIASINSKAGNKVILCSGFFQELFKGNPYQASKEQNLDDILRMNSIEITTIGIHNNSWLKSYKNFRNNLLNKNVNIKAKYIYNFKWHAKIFILKDNDTPILGIIGSSNITRNAFSDSIPFNYEADVVLWSDTNKKINDVVTAIAQTIKDEKNQTNDPHEVIITDYDPKKNHELSIEDRLNRLNEDVKNLNIRDLPE